MKSHNKDQNIGTFGMLKLYVSLRVNGLNHTLLSWK